MLSACPLTPQPTTPVLSPQPLQSKVNLLKPCPDTRPGHRASSGLRLQPALCVWPQLPGLQNCSTGPPEDRGPWCWASAPRDLLRTVGLGAGPQLHILHRLLCCSPTFFFLCDTTSFSWPFQDHCPGSCLPTFSRTSLHQCPPPSPLISHRLSYQPETSLSWSHSSSTCRSEEPTASPTCIPSTSYTRALQSR